MPGAVSSSRPHRRPSSGLSARSLARPDDPRDPLDLVEFEDAWLVGRVEGMQFDLLAGLAVEDFGHYFAVTGLDHHTVSSPHLFGRRHHDAIPLPIERLHGIALHFE